jgi:hypothetical protein
MLEFVNDDVFASSLPRLRQMFRDVTKRRYLGVHLRSTLNFAIVLFHFASFHQPSKRSGAFLCSLLFTSTLFYQSKQDSQDPKRLCPLYFLHLIPHTLVT